MLLINIETVGDMCFSTISGTNSLVEYNTLPLEVKAHGQ